MNFLLKSIVAVALLLPSCANAMTFRSELLPSGLLVLHFNGKIEHGDFDRAADFYRRLGQQYQGTKAVVSLNSPGGYVVEATKMAVYLHELNQSTAVAPGNRCVSACFMLFAAGKQQFVGRGAIIGVHRAGEYGVQDDPISRDLTVKMSRLLLAFGVSPQIIAKLIATDFTNVSVLNEADLRSMQVTMLDTSPAVALRPSTPPTVAVQQPAPVPTNRVARTKPRERNYERRGKSIRLQQKLNTFRLLIIIAHGDNYWMTNSEYMMQLTNRQRGDYLPWWRRVCRWFR